MENMLRFQERNGFLVIKGGAFRKWYGNNYYLINWEHGGHEVLQYAAELYGSPTRTIRNIQFYFKKAVTWSSVSSAYFGVRFCPEGFLFATGGSSAFPNEKDINMVLGLLCSAVANRFLGILSQTLNIEAGDIGTIPFVEDAVEKNRISIENVVSNTISFAKNDWDSFETSWDFTENPLIRQNQNTPSATISSVIPAGMPEPLDRASESSHRDVNLSTGTPAQSSICADVTLPSMALDSGIPAGMTAFSIVGWVSDSVTQQIEATDVGLRDKAANPTYALTSLEQCFNRWQTQNRAAIIEMQRLEEENNRLFIEAYGLQDELSPEVPEEQITLVRADRAKDSRRLISYAIGCMMGRYRLDKPGLI